MPARVPSPSSCSSRGYGATLGLSTKARKASGARLTRRYGGSRSRPMARPASPRLSTRASRTPRMRVMLALLLALAPSLAAAQAITASPGPDSVAVTVYRDPNRGNRAFNLDWLNGYALISETRRVSLPAGETELRFEGVAGGII